MPVIARINQDFAVKNTYILSVEVISYICRYGISIIEKKCIEKKCDSGAARAGGKEGHYSLLTTIFFILKSTPIVDI